MNKVYKLVWSKTRNMYVAVCEFAKSRTKAKRKLSRTLVAGVLACVLSCGVTGSAFAEIIARYDSFNLYVTPKKLSDTAVVFKDSASVTNWIYDMANERGMTVENFKSYTNNMEFYYIYDYNNNRVSIASRNVDGSTFVVNPFPNYSNLYIENYGVLKNIDVKINADFDYGMSNIDFANHKQYWYGIPSVEVGVGNSGTDDKNVTVGVGNWNNGHSVITGTANTSTGSVVNGMNNVANYSVVVGNNNKSTSAIMLGSNLTNSDAKRSIVIGNNYSVSGGISGNLDLDDDYVITIGNYVDANVSVYGRSVSYNDPYDYLPHDDIDSYVGLYGSVAIGAYSKIGEVYAVSLGTKATSIGPMSASLGAYSYASGNYATAIGAQSYAYGNNSVAIGNGSVADEDNVVAFGSRRLVDVDDGINDWDAASYGQVKSSINTLSVSNGKLDYTTVDGTNGSIDLPGGKTYSGGTGIQVSNSGEISTKNVLMYDGDTNDIASLAGNSGTKLTNLKQATLSNTSTDAVIGAQLYATNQNIAGFATDINRNKTNIQNLNTSVTAALESVSASSQLVDVINNTKADKSLNNLDAAGQQVIATAAANAVQEYMAANGLNTNNGNNVNTNSTLNASLRTVSSVRQTVDPVNMSLMSVNPASADTNFVVYDNAQASQITLEGPLGTGTKITNVAAGELSAASTDAVNGQQLYEVTQHFDEFQSALSSNNTSIARAQTDINHMKTANIKLESDVNTLKTEMETGFNVTIDGAKVKTVNPANNQVDFKSGNGIALENDNGSVKISLDAEGLVTEDVLKNYATHKEVDEKLDTKADKDSVYTKDETDTMLSLKADKSDVYTKQETDIKLSTKADTLYVNSEISSVRTELGQKADTEYVDEHLKEKANKDSVYTKAESNDLFVGKESYRKDMNGKANVDASNIDVGVWTDRLGTGEIAPDNDGLVKGGTVYEALRHVQTNDMIVPDIETGAVRIAGNGRYDAFESVDISKSDGSPRALRGVVTDPTDASSAANVGYVDYVGNAVASQLNQSISKLDDRITKVGAGAAALAGLRPVDTDADQLWSMSASVGNYKGKTASAIGLFYRPTDRVLVGIGGTVGDDENMVNGSISFALNKGKNIGLSKAAMAKKIGQLEQDNANMKQAMAAMAEKLNSLSLVENVKASFPDVPKEHWASNAVETLHGNNMVQGYPDGTFKGDRPMTRYEYAEMLYNALSKGATVKKEHIRQYAPELRKVAAKARDKKMSEYISTITPEMDARMQAAGQAYNNQ